MKPDDREQQRIIAGLKVVDAQFSERALALVREYHVASLHDVPREKRAELFKWRTEEYRKVYGMDPIWGDPTPESKREKRRQRRSERLGNGDSQPRGKAMTREERRARRRELREQRKALKEQGS